MKRTPLDFSEVLSPARAGEIPVAWYPDKRIVRLCRFRAAVSLLAGRLAALPEKRWALCCEDAARAAAGFFAAIYAGKDIVLPGHSRESLLREQAENFDGVLSDAALRLDCPVLPVSFEETQTPAPALPAWNEAAVVHFFTSGSTGKPKHVPKTLAQLRRENEMHARYWGQRLEGAFIAGTTSHAHLYGFQFRVLLPLTLGCPFNAFLIEYHEQLHAVPTPYALVASPAFLKRFDAQSALPPCRFVLSAGGLLPEADAIRTREKIGVFPVEIFGSTENGAMGLRDTAIMRDRWMPAPGVEIECDADGRMFLRSDFLPTRDRHATDDKIEMLAGGEFRLLGRIDRVLKIEEKRVSLAEVEARLRALAGVADAAVTATKNKGRDFLAAALVLDAEGTRRFGALGHGKFLLDVRRNLRAFLEPVAIPRQIRIFEKIPENSQGKRDYRRIAQCFALLFPREINRAVFENAAALELEISPELLWFAGHFDRMPLLPGVTQLHWAIHYGKTLFAPAKQLLRVDAIKFQKPISPGDSVLLSLAWSPAQNRLDFSYKIAGDTASGGRLILR